MQAHATKNIQNENAKVQYIQNMVSLDDGIVLKNDTGSFYIKGKLRGKNSEKIAKQDKINFTFYDIQNEDKIPVDETCTVINHDLNEFEVQCIPEHNFSAYLFQSNGTSMDEITGINLNMTKYHDYAHVTSYKNNTNTGFYKWVKKPNSGLSGGAIAAIVIICAIILILISILAMCCKRRKNILENSNNSAIVGLKSIENESDK